MKIMNKEEKRLYDYNLKHKTDENGEVFKQCGICNEWLLCTEEYFYKNKSSHMDGLNTYCKKCTIAKSIDRNHNHYEEYLALSRMYSTKPEARSKKRENGKKRRLNGYNKEYQRMHPEKLKQYRLDREQNKTHTISKEEWISCMNYFNNECCYCGLPIEDHLTTYAGITKQSGFHKEHVNHEGENDLSNCVPACKSCNCQKWKYEFKDWYNEDNIKFTKERLDKIHKWLNEDYKLYIKVKKDDKEITII